MDGSEMSAEALRYALEAHPDAAISVLHVVGEPSGMMAKATGLALEDDFQQAAEDAAEEVLGRAREIAAEYDSEIDTEIGWGSPAKVIVRRSEDFDTVVIGSHAGSIADRLFVGDVAKTVFHRSPVPVTVVR
jgi:nucleotide-binding universal stress UspA family protein